MLRRKCRRRSRRLGSLVACAIYTCRTRRRRLRLMSARTRTWRGTLRRRLNGLSLRMGPYRHSEGNSDSHVKSILVGASVSMPVEGGKLALGRWQGVFFCEFDGPRERKLNVQVVAG